MPPRPRGAGAASAAAATPARLWERLLAFLIARVFPIFLTSFNALLTVWRLALQWLNSHLLYLEYGGRPATDFYHKAVLIGDGLAQGFGAWVSFASASGPMRYLIEGAARHPAIKMDWVFFERGALYSTTNDWLPPGAKQAEDVGIGSGAEGKEEEEEEDSKDESEREQLRPSSSFSSPSAWSSSSLLHSVVTSRSGRDVCLFVVMVGLQDILQVKDPDALLALAVAAEEEEADRKQYHNKGMQTLPTAANTTTTSSSSTATSPQAAPKPFCQTVQNLRSILLHLLSLPHAPHVCLCTLPTVGAPSSIRARAIKGVNAQIIRMVRTLPPSLPPQQQQQQQNPRVTLVELSQRRVSRAEGRAFDGVHFTSAGYKSLADAVLEEVAPAMIKHEWAILQEYVSGRKTKTKAGGRKGWWFGGGKEKKQ